MQNLLFERTIRNLHENGKLTFKKLKDSLSLSSNFILEKKDLQKGKKILLSYSIKEAKLIIADNKNNINKDTININEYAKSCGELKEEIFYSLNDLEKNISRMNLEDQESVFGSDNNIYYNLELLLKPEKAFNYNTKFFNFLPEGHAEYDKSGKMIVKEVTIQTNKFESLGLEEKVGVFQHVLWSVLSIDDIKEYFHSITPEGHKPYYVSKINCFVFSRNADTLKKPTTKYVQAKNMFN